MSPDTNPTDVGQAGEADPPPETEQLREDIAETREELGQTVEALAQKADVKAQVEEKKAEVKERVEEKKAEVKGKVTGAVGGAGDKVADTRAKVAQAAPVQQVSERPWIPAAAGVAAGLVLLFIIRRRRS